MALPRVVLDTNVLVSGLAYPNSIPGYLVDLWRNRGLELISSSHILGEVERVLPRMRGVRNDPAAIYDAVLRLRVHTLFVEPLHTFEADLRDAADQPVLGTLLASNADFLVTGDKDLLALAAKYPIVRPAEFRAKRG